MDVVATFHGFIASLDTQIAREDFLGGRGSAATTPCTFSVSQAIQSLAPEPLPRLPVDREWDPGCLHLPAGHPPFGHLAATRACSDSSALPPGEVRDWGGPAYLGHAFAPNLCQGPSWPCQGKRCGCQSLPLWKRRTLKPSSVAMRSTSKGCPRWKGMPEPRSSAPQVPCSRELKTTVDSSRRGLKCRAASLPGSSLHSRFT